MGFGAEGERGVLNRYLNNRLIVTEGFGPSFFCSCGGMIACLAMLVVIGRPTGSRPTNGESDGMMCNGSAMREHARS